MNLTERNKQVNKLSERLDNNKGWEWKGKPIILREDWKRLAGYTEFTDVFDDDNVITPEERWSWKTDLNDSMGIYDKIDSRLRKEINPKALQYFPHDLVSVVFYRSYSCPKAPDLFKEWISDYKELLVAKGVNRHLYDGTWAHPPKGHN